MGDYGHLGEKAIDAMMLSNEERIDFINRPRWIGYSRAISILEKIEDLYKHHKVHRMPNMLLYGNTNNGKTMIVNRFTKRHPAYDNPHGNWIIAPVLYIQAPPGPDLKMFCERILQRLFVPYKEHASGSSKLSQVVNVLNRVELKMMIIDEIHRVISGHIDKQRQMLRVIHFLGNELQIPIVGVGTKEAVRAIKIDDQLENRFKPVTLPLWKMDEDFLKLLASFERMLPLKKPSGLTESSMANKLLSKCEGILGELNDLLTQSAIHAIKSGEERITKTVIDRSGYESPSERRRSAEKAN